MLISIKKAICLIFPICIISGCNDNHTKNEYSGPNCKVYISEYVTAREESVRCDWITDNNKLVCTFEESGGEIIAQYETQEDFLMEDSIIGLISRSSTYYKFLGSESFQYYSYNIYGGLEEIISTSRGDTYESDNSYIRWITTGFDSKNRPTSGMIEHQPENDCKDWTFTRNYYDEDFKMETTYEGEGACFLSYQSTTQNLNTGIIEYSDGEQTSQTTIINTQQFCRDSS